MPAPGCSAKPISRARPDRRQKHLSYRCRPGISKGPPDRRDPTCATSQPPTPYLSTSRRVGVRNRRAPGAKPARWWRVPGAPLAPMWRAGDALPAQINDLPQRRAEKTGLSCQLRQPRVIRRQAAYSPAAASMIGTNFSAVRLAPPTSAPSTSGQPSSDAAFAPLTDPP